MKGKVEHIQIFFYTTDDLKCTAGHLKEIANKRYGSTRNTIHSYYIERLILSPKKFGSALKYNETLAGVPQIRHCHTPHSTLHTPHPHSCSTHSKNFVHTQIFSSTLKSFCPHSFFWSTLPFSIHSALPFLVG